MEFGELESIAIYSLLDIAIEHLERCLMFKGVPRTGRDNLNKALGILKKFRREGFINHNELILVKLLIGGAYWFKGNPQNVKNLLIEAISTLDYISSFLYLQDCNLGENISQHYEDAQSDSYETAGI